jgi:uncharacterized protein
MAKRVVVESEHVVEQIATSLAVQAVQVRAARELLDGGDTIPFIARYRKEATGGLDELALRSIDDGLAKARDLVQRKSTILRTIDAQGKLTEQLRRQIEACPDKRQLEDLYLPFKPKRKTRATVARDRGLQPLATILIRQEQLGRPRHEVLRPYVAAEKEVPDEEAALSGACDIVAEHWAEDAQTRKWLVERAQRGSVVAQVKRGKKDPASKFATYFDHQERVARVPSHRLLAMKRGESEGVLRVGLKLDDETLLGQLKTRLVHNRAFEFYRDLLQTVDDCYTRLLLPATESAVLQQLKERADEEAIAVFAKNLRELLLSPPAGPHVTIGVDPGFRTGCKIAVVDGTGKFLTATVIYPTAPRNDVAAAGRILQQLIANHNAKLIAIGNGTASRETHRFVTDLLQQENLDVTAAVVSEAGASIYSASDTAVAEYPDLDITVRGAISIAHRLQDPLGELVKIDPKSIGVGQYQHDVNQPLLRKCLDREVESCVNLVGVDANLASPSLLSHVAGIGPKLAERIVAYRDEHGRFDNRKQVLSVPKLGRKAYQQAAGFLRIRAGQQPLDNSAVHPESYAIVGRMAQQLGVESRQLVGNATMAGRLRAEDFVDDQFGLPTVEDILLELAKPGRDPRSEFQVVRFADDINEMKDLRQGLVLEGVVTNVARFGAFVDIGVHQDGLIHISELDTRYVQDPSDVVSVGDVVRVKVLDVDLDRRRIALSRKQVQVQ